MYSRIIGTGSYLPERVLTNAELEGMVDTTDEWILSRTGIGRRHLAAASQTTCDLAEAAARRAMQAAGVGPSDIDFIALGTTTPDQVFPSTACLVRARLGIASLSASDTTRPAWQQCTERPAGWAFTRQRQHG
jgi:3-oxoacyl-[acyl-carrier-protein] synthase-3